MSFATKRPASNSEAYLRMKVNCEIDVGTPFKTMMSLPSAYQEAAMAFNLARETMASAHLVMEELKGAVADYQVIANELMGRPLVRALALEGVTPNEVESDDGFAALLAKINGEKNLLARMKICEKVNETIYASIESWMSKVIKVRSMSEETGNTSGEVNTAQARVIRLEEIVKALKTRGDTITTVYDAARNSLMKQMERSAKDFRRIFAK